MVGSFDSFLMLVHALRLLCFILVDVMTSSHLLRHSVNKFDFRLYDAASKGLIKIFLVYALIGQLDWERILFDILLVCVF